MGWAQVLCAPDQSVELPIINKGYIFEIIPLKNRVKFNDKQTQLCMAEYLGFKLSDLRQPIDGMQAFLVAASVAVSGAQVSEMVAAAGLTAPERQAKLTKIIAVSDLIASGEIVVCKKPSQ